MTVEMMRRNVKTNKGFIKPLYKDLVHRGIATVRYIGEIKIVNNKFVCNGKEYNHIEQIFI